MSQSTKPSTNTEIRYKPVLEAIDVIDANPVDFGLLVSSANQLQKMQSNQAKMRLAVYDFYYENPATPVRLQHEVAVCLMSNEMVAKRRWQPSELSQQS